MEKKSSLPILRKHGTGPPFWQNCLPGVVEREEETDQGKETASREFQRRATMNICFNRDLTDNH